MNINNNISFGRVVRVKAPIKVAKQIADIANGELESGNNLVDEKICSTFRDLTEGRAIAVTGKHGKSYIISGMQTKEYDMAHDYAMREIMWANDVFGSTDKGESRCSEIMDCFDSNIKYIISKEKPQLNMRVKAKVNQDKVNLIDVKI